MDQDERLKHFFEELDQVTIKYNIAIGGCGCCGSPFLIDLTQQKYTSGYYFVERVEWNGIEYDYTSISYS